MSLIALLSAYVAVSVIVSTLCGFIYYVADWAADWCTARAERRFQTDLAELLRSDA